MKSKIKKLRGGFRMNPSHNELWECYTQDKSQEIRNQIVEQYLELVSFETKKIKTPVGIDPQDIYQFGVVGLIKAVEKYDPEKGAQFESYAPYRIRGEIVDHLRQYANYSQGVSRTTLKKIKEMERIKAEIEMIKNDKVNEKDIMDYLNIGEKEFSKLQLKTLIYNGVSIEAFSDNPHYEKKTLDVNDDAELQILEEEKKIDLMFYIEKLKDKEKYVIKNYYFQHKNLNAISKELGVSEARVSQLHQEGIHKLRKLLSSDER